MRGLPAVALASLLTACGAKAKPAPAPLENHGPQSKAEAPPEYLPMRGPYEMLSDVPKAKVPGGEGELPLAEHQLASVPNVQAPLQAAELLEWNDGSADAMCAVMVKVAGAFYVGEPFECGAQDSRTMTSIEVHGLTAEGGRVELSYAIHFHASNMDNEPGEIDQRDEHAITCLVDRVPPACTAP